MIPLTKEQIMYDINIQMVIESGEDAEDVKKFTFEMFMENSKKDEESAQMFDWCTRCMDIHAKQTSIAFAEWKRNINVCPNGDLWYMYPDRQTLYTTEQLFESFNQSI